MRAESADLQIAMDHHLATALYCAYSAGPMEHSKHVEFAVYFHGPMADSQRVMNLRSEFWLRFTWLQQLERAAAQLNRCVTGQFVDGDIAS